MGEDDGASPAAAWPGGNGRRAGRVASRVIAGVLSAAALLGTAYGYRTLDQVQGGINTITMPGRQEGAGPPQDDGAIDILLAGVDTRTDMQGNPLPPKMLKTLRTEATGSINTDTLIILRIPKDGGKPSGVSIPRDTWVKQPGGEMGKINSAYGVAKVRAAQELRADGVDDTAEIARRSDAAGRVALMRTVQELTHVRLDHYAEVNLLGFYLLTKALGGVEVCLNQATSDKDSGANFAAGRQTLSGAEALSFVRQRKNLPRGGLDRIVRQQAFLASALHKVLSAGTLTDQAKLTELTEAIKRSVVLDDGMQLLEFAGRVKGVASGDIDFVTIPVKQVGARSPDGLSIVTVDPAKVRAFMASLAGQAAQPSGGGGSPQSHPRQIDAGGVPCVN